jgi:hypothetical protein
MLSFEVVTGDGVGDDENFPHDSGEGDLSGSIVVVGDAIVEVAHRGGMADSGAGGVEQGAAHERSSMTGFGLPDSFSAFVGMGGEADEGGYLLSTQTTEFRQVGDERRSDDRADTAHGAQDLGQAIELPIAGDVMLDRLFNGVKALGERRDDEGQATWARLSRTNGSFARSTRQPSACRASTSCLRRAASARRRSSARNVAGRAARPLASAR